jgi:hypothetical protein
MTSMRKSMAVKLAGAAALASASQAYGQIIPLDLPGTVTDLGPGTEPQEFYNLSAGGVDLTTNTGPDFRFEYDNGGGGYIFSGAKIYAGAGGGVAVAVNYYAPEVPAGTKVGSDTFTFTTGTYSSFLVQNVAYGDTYSNQQPNTPEYLVFQFTGTDNKLHDGYFEVETLAGGPGTVGSFAFLQGAYNSQPDTGDGLGDIVVPEPGTLSSLIMGAAALGAVGLVRRRRAIAAGV